MALALVAGLASGCGGTATNALDTSLSSGQVATIARACHEAGPNVARSLNAARKALAARGLHGAASKLVQDVGNLAAVVGSQSSKLPDCSGLIHLLTRKFELGVPTTRPVMTPKLPATSWPPPEKIERR
jgi:hypothetical protein